MNRIEFDLINILLHTNETKRKDRKRRENQSQSLLLSILEFRGRRNFFVPPEWIDGCCTDADSESNISLSPRFNNFGFFTSVCDGVRKDEDEERERFGFSTATFSCYDNSGFNNSMNS